LHGEQPEYKFGNFHSSFYETSQNLYKAFILTDKASDNFMNRDPIQEHYKNVAVVLCNAVACYRDLRATSKANNQRLLDFHLQKPSASTSAAKQQSTSTKMISMQRLSLSPLVMT
jgi:hypothetical protein